MLLIATNVVNKR